MLYEVITEFSEMLYDAYSRGGIDMENLAYDPANGLAIPVDYDTDCVITSYSIHYTKLYDSAKL